MTFFFSCKNILLITFLSLFDGCFHGQRKEISKTVIPFSTNPDYKVDIGKDDEPAGSGDFQMKLWQRGIDFYARGNEPSWSLDMDFEQGFYFKALNGIEMITPPVDGKKAMDAKGLRFYAKSESGTLIVTILEQECKDSMSGETFTDKIKIVVKQSAEDEFQNFTGCGRYVSDYGLHDIWVLTHLHGKNLQDIILEIEGFQHLSFTSGMEKCLAIPDEMITMELIISQGSRDTIWRYRHD